MKERKLPRIATWLLRRFGPSEQNQVLVGDLAEHYRSGRSRWWYWREVMIALSVGTLRETWQNRMMVLMGLAVGWLMVRNLDPLIMRLFVFRPMVARVIVERIVFGFLVGFVLALLHRPRHIAPIMLLAGSYIATTDLYRLYSPGVFIPDAANVIMTAAGSRPPMNVYTWLLFTFVDLIFVAAMIWAGTLQFHRARTSLVAAAVRLLIDDSRTR